jgi:hypothetical protein
MCLDDPRPAVRSSDKTLTPGGQSHLRTPGLCLPKARARRGRRNSGLARKVSAHPRHGGAPRPDVPAEADPTQHARRPALKAKAPERRPALATTTHIGGIRSAGHLIALVGIACSLTVADTFAGDPQPGILGDDNRKVIHQQGAPWTAVGQVNVTGYRRAMKCTGSLIASNLVITAAHCAMDPWRRKFVPLHQIHFVAGVRASGWLGHSTAKCLHFAPGYEYVGPNKILPSLPFQDVPRGAFSHDVALIVLKDDLNNVAPLELDRAELWSSGVPLVHASYAADRRYVLTGHFGVPPAGGRSRSLVYRLRYPCSEFRRAGVHPRRSGFEAGHHHGGGGKGVCLNRCPSCELD